MATTNYFTVNGELVGESGPGGTQFYHTDAIGSVTMTTSTNASVLNAYRFTPYGAQLSKTGTFSDPHFSWVGSAGYRATKHQHSDYYVRARHFAQAEGVWNSMDPLWPEESPFIYVGATPTSSMDPSGLTDSCPMLLTLHVMYAVYNKGLPHNKLFKLLDNTCIACGGCLCDGSLTLTIKLLNVIASRIELKKLKQCKINFAMTFSESPARGFDLCRTNLGFVCTPKPGKTCHGHLEDTSSVPFMVDDYELFGLAYWIADTDQHVTRKCMKIGKTHPI